MCRLVSFDGYQLIALSEADIPVLQALYEANPEYCQLVMGRRPLASEAHDDFHSLPPPDFPMNKKWMIGFINSEGELIGVAEIVSDLFAPGVWHIGFFMIATPLHGRGIAKKLYDSLEAWMKAQGACWLRLGVVTVNRRGEQFWRRCGFRQVRTRENYALGDRQHTLCMLVKPLGCHRVAAYLDLVARDRPD